MSCIKRNTRYVIILICFISLMPSALGKVRWVAEGNVGSGLLLGLPGNSSSTVNYRLGPSAIIPVKGWFSIRPGLMWSHKGGILEGYYGNEQIVSARMPISLDFLEMPVMCALRIPIKQKFALTLKVGPYAAVWLSGKTKVKTEGEGSIKMPGNLFSSNCDYYGNAQTSNKKIFELPKLNRWDIGTTWGMGFEFLQHYAIGGNISWGLTRLAPEYLADNVIEGVMQVIFMMDRIRPFNSMISFSYIF